MVAIGAKVSLDGPFFKNPIGRLHKNTYTVLKDEGEYAVDIAQSVLMSKARRPTGRLASNIVKVPRRMRGGRAEVVVSANYGPEPSVRYYNRFIDKGVRKGARVFRGYNFYSAAARATQGHINSRIGSIEKRLVEGIT